MRRQVIRQQEILAGWVLLLSNALICSNFLSEQSSWLRKVWKPIWPKSLSNCHRRNRLLLRAGVGWDPFQMNRIERLPGRCFLGNESGLARMVGLGFRPTHIGRTCSKLWRPCHHSRSAITQEARPAAGLEPIWRGLLAAGVEFGLQ